MPHYFLCHFLLIVLHWQFCTSLFTYICLFFPSIFIVNCLHNPWAYINLFLNVFHFPLCPLTLLIYLIWYFFIILKFTWLLLNLLIFSPFACSCVLITNLTRLWELLHRRSLTHALELYLYCVDHSGLVKDWFLSSSFFYKVHNLVILCPACKSTVGHDLFISCHLLPDN
jgi:hypothetical protein